MISIVVKTRRNAIAMHRSRLIEESGEERIHIGGNVFSF